ncbi:MAG: patatin-like phospholipase family protein [Pseudomonadota bacterium]
MATKHKQQKTINIALQGGGSHGALTWGVLDYLLEDGRLDIEGFSATSAGSMNAVAYAYGKMVGGNKGARECLEMFWRHMNGTGQLFSPVRQLPWEKLGHQWNMDYSINFHLFEAFTRLFSPYQFNPANFNILKMVLEETIDFDALRDCQNTKLFINATNVQTGKVKVFKTNEIDVDVIMASASLPFLFHAVPIDGQTYWDGGYSGNPALFPLFYHTDSRDIVIVHVNPIERTQLPQTPPEIYNRINEITFNSSLLKELRAVAFVQKLLQQNMIKDEFRDQFKDILMHSIHSDSAMCDLGVASKFNVNWQFLIDLKNRGRTLAKTWLQENYSKIGKKSSVDLRSEFLDLGSEHIG